MDDKIKQAMIDGVLDGVRDATRLQFKGMQFGTYRSEESCEEARVRLREFGEAATVVFKMIDELPE